MALIDTVLEHKQAADEKVGQLTQRLDDCGPRGNHSVEQKLNYERGRRDALLLVAGWMIQDREDADKVSR